MKRKAPTLKKYFQHFQVGQRGMPAKGPNARQKKVIKAGLKRAPRPSKTPLEACFRAETSDIHRFSS